MRKSKENPGSQAQNEGKTAQVSGAGQSGATQSMHGIRVVPAGRQRWRTDEIAARIDRALSAAVGR